jgi:hypothetical protein
MRGQSLVICPVASHSDLDYRYGCLGANSTYDDGYALMNEEAGVYGPHRCWLPYAL